MNKIIAPLLMLCAALCVFSTSQAAGINCKIAQTRVENTICTSEKILLLDQQLSGAYAKLATLSADKKNQLRKSQQTWLTERNACEQNIDCLITKYESRLAVLNQQRRANQIPPADNVDRAAQKQLVDAITARMATDKEFPLESALQSFLIESGMTSFSNNGERQDDTIYRFPKTKPEGVSEDEWQALVASHIDGGGENGSASYVLLDIDNDGKRDLIVDSYVGGTGLFNYISVLPRRDKRFVGQPYTINSDADTDALYSINGRGSNQQADWIRLQGRVYVAYRDSSYGLDNLFLLRPLYPSAEQAVITVHYRYVFSIDKNQIVDDKPFSLDDKTHAGIQKAIEPLKHFSRNQDGAVSDKPLCPIPPDTSEDDQGNWYGFGTGHYSFEIITDLPVWIEQQCYIAQVVNWFGRYEQQNGLLALLWLKNPAQIDKEQTYNVTARRRAINVDTRMGAFNTD